MANDGNRKNNRMLEGELQGTCRDAECKGEDEARRQKASQKGRNDVAGVEGNCMTSQGTWTDCKHHVLYVRG